MHALALLGGTARNFNNPHLLIRPFISREAVLSSRIEGTQASLSDLFLLEAQPQTDPSRLPVPDVIEVRNYVQALDYGLSADRTLPLSLRLIRELHQRLMQNVRGENQTPGEFRRTQVHIGSSRRIEEATYVPPPAYQLEACLAPFEEFLHRQSALPPLIRIALAHYQFEAIHPFRDGNGRVGRLLISLMLCEYRLIEQPLLYLSAYFERHRREYYDHLLSISQRGEWEEWLDFFLRGVIEQAQDAQERAHRLMALWQDYRQRLMAARASALPLQLVNRLFHSPYVNSRLAQVLLDVTHRSAMLIIEKLVAVGILQEVPVRSRGRVYCAAEILNILDEIRAHAPSRQPADPAVKTQSESS